MTSIAEHCRVLVAEDHELSRELLDRTLKSWGYEVVAVDNGTDALAILESGDAPHVALLDWMMPGMTGPEVCKRLREKPDRPYVYLILLTARGERQEIASGLEAGADDYIVKPFRSEELQARLQIGRRVLLLEHRLAELTSELQKYRPPAT